MYNKKEHDWILETINNPDFTNTEFKVVGVNAENTSIGDKSMYENSDIIRNNPAFQTEGKFSSEKFESFYNYQLQRYNEMATDTSQDDLMLKVSFDKDNIYAPIEKRNYSPQTEIIRMDQNPLWTSIGFAGFNAESDNKYTTEEIAQMYPIYDKKTDTFTPYTAEESLFKNWDRTVVLATYDFDADEDGNPVTDPLEIVHPKGSPKINKETGAPYYEFADGPTYGKTVLSKFNILTKEKSPLNDFDFFDSDDKRKSVFGSLTRNAVMIAPYFMPAYVSIPYIALNLSIGLADVFAKLGKMATGSDNEFLSGIENFHKSIQLGTSEYGREHAWSAENIINLAGGTFEFLYNMRAIAEYGPTMFGKSKLPKTIDEANAWKTARAKEIVSAHRTPIMNSKVPLLGNSETALAQETFLTDSALLDGALVQADGELNTLMNNYNKIGEYISRTYMALSFGTATYEEAKMQGASDAAATALTLGSIAGQYALLSTHIGNWVLPSKLDKFQKQKMAELLVGGGEKISKDNTITKNLKGFGELFDDGKKLVIESYTPAKMASEATVRGAIAGGIEMTSFEVLRDLTASVYNLANTITGQDGHMEAFSDGDMGALFDRYGTSFLGGALGGLVFAPSQNFERAKAIHNMKYSEALQKTIYMSREDKLNEIIKEIEDLPVIKTKYLTDFEKYTTPDGKKLYTQGTDSQNLDIQYKNMIIDRLKDIDTILRTYELKVSNKDVESKLMADARFATLLKSKVVNNYLQNFNSAVTDVYTAHEELSKLETTTEKQAEGITDRSERENPESTEKRRNGAKQKLEDAIAKAKKYIDGTYSKDFITDAIFDMHILLNSPFLQNTFEQWAIKKENVNSLNDIAQSRLEQLQEEYKNTATTDFIIQAHQMFRGLNLDYNKTLSENPDQQINELQHNILRKFALSQDSLRTRIEEYLQTLDKTSRFGIILLASYNDEFFKILNDRMEDREASKYDAEAWELYSRMIADDGGLLSERVNEVLLDKIIDENGVQKTRIEDIVSKILDGSSQLAYEVKSNLLQLIKNLTTTNDNVNLSLLYAEVKDKESTIIQKGVDELSEKLFKFKVSDLLDELLKVFNSSDSADTIQIDPKYITRLENAQTALELYRSVIVASIKSEKNLENLFGYNEIYNELYGTNLETISEKEALSKIAEINSLVSDINLYHTTLTILEGRKLQTHFKVGHQFVNKIYTKLKNLVSIIPNDWDKTELVNAINSIEIIDLLDKAVLSEEHSLKYQQECIKLFDAIYDFFQKNKDKVQDTDKLATLITTANFKYDCDRGQIAVDNVQLDDRTFLNLLMSFSALKYSTFKYHYREILKLENKTIPLPAQELCMFMAVSNLVNTKQFEAFTKAYNKTVVKDQIDDEYYIHQPFVVIDSITGVGKSQAIIKQAVKIASLIDKNSVNSIHFVHTSKDNAKILSDECEITTSHLYDHISFMREYFPDYDIERLENGRIKLNLDHYVAGEDIARYYLKLKDGNTKPSLVVIDEVSRLSIEDYDLLKLMHDEWGTRFILAGDMSQSGITSEEIDVSSRSDVFKFNKLVSKVVPHNLIFTPKLAMSFRADNNLKQSNNTNLAQNHKIFGKQGGKIELEYFEDADGAIYGDRNITFSSEGLKENGAINKKITKFLEFIKRSKQTVAFIYNSKDSEVYKFIKTLPPDLQNIITFKEGNSAQGLEYDFCICDFSDITTIYPDSSSTYALDTDYYTRVTRSRKGTLAIVQRTSDFKFITNEANRYFELGKISDSVIEKQLKRELSILNQLELKLENVVTEIPVREKSSASVIPYEPQLNEEDEQKELDSFAEDAYNPRGILKASDNGETSYSKTNEVAEISSYTLMTNEVGGIVQRNPDNNRRIIKLVDGYEDRRDGINGLEYLRQKGKIRGSELIAGDVFDIITAIKNYIATTNNKADMIECIRQLLQRYGFNREDNTGMYITFALISRFQELEDADGTINEQDGHKRLKKSIKEKQISIFQPIDTDRRDDPLHSSIVAIIGNKELGDYLEIPIMKLQNPETFAFIHKLLEVEEKTFYLDDSGNRVESIVKEVYGHIRKMRVNDKNPMRMRHWLAEHVLNKDIIKDVHPALITYAKLFDIFSISNPVVIPITLNDGNWVPLDSFYTTGPVQSLDRGGEHYTFEQLRNKFDAKWVDAWDFIEQSNLKFTEKVYVAKEPVVVDGKMIIRAGIPFVLVGDRLFESDKQLIDAYYTQQGTKNKRVAIKYLQKPFADIEEYFNTIVEARKPKEQQETHENVGNLFTPFRIFQLLQRVDENILSLSNAAKLESRKVKQYELLKKITEEINKITDPIQQRQKMVSILSKTLKSLIDEKGAISISEQEYKLLNAKDYNLSLYQLFRSYLVDVVTNFNMTAKTAAQKADPDVVSRIVKTLKDNNFNVIPYELELERGVSNENIAGVELMSVKTAGIRGAEKYSIKNEKGETLGFKILGKIDSTEYFGDFTPLLNNILSQLILVSSGGTEYVNRRNDFILKKYDVYRSDLSTIPKEPIFYGSDSDVIAQLMGDYGNDLVEAKAKIDRNQNLVYIEHNGKLHVFDVRHQGTVERDSSEPGLIKLKTKDNNGNGVEYLFTLEKQRIAEQDFEKFQLIKITNEKVKEPINNETLSNDEINTLTDAFATYNITIPEKAKASDIEKLLGAEKKEDVILIIKNAGLTVEAENRAEEIIEKLYETKGEKEVDKCSIEIMTRIG